jgi:hypothetical protein
MLEYSRVELITDTAINSTEYYNNGCLFLKRILL